MQVNASFIGECACNLKNDSPDTGAAEEIHLRLRKEQRGMRVVRIPSDVRSVSRTCKFASRNELTIDHLAQHGAPYNVEAHEAAHSNASAHGATRGR